jgi:disulfide bond formation protein DsbB
MSWKNGVPWLTVALAMLMVVALAACQGGGQPAGGTAPAAGGVSGAGGDDDEAEEAEEVEAGDPEEGKEAFGKTCASCHGPDGMGLPNLGKNLHSNAFLAGLSDEEAIAFLKVGRAADDPLNTTGVAMPPKGGNPAFTDEDLANIIAYVRSLE